MERIMNKTASIVAAITLAVFAFGAIAWAEVPTPKIALVDLRKCLAESAKGKKLKEEFEAKVAKVDQKGMALEKEAKDLVGELERQAALLSDQVKREKQTRLLAIRDEMKNLDKQKRDVNDELTSQVIRDVQGIVKNLAEIRGYTMVFNDGGPWLIYSAPSTDITAEVIKLYDQASGK
jgi:Skp family chaperone for outer membrane proteins